MRATRVAAWLATLCRFTDRLIIKASCEDDADLLLIARATDANSKNEFIYLHATWQSLYAPLYSARAATNPQTHKLTHILTRRCSFAVVQSRTAIQRSEDRKGTRAEEAMPLEDRGGWGFSRHFGQMAIDCIHLLVDGMGSHEPHDAVDGSADAHSAARERGRRAEALRSGPNDATRVFFIFVFTSRSIALCLRSR